LLPFAGGKWDKDMQAKKSSLRTLWLPRNGLFEQVGVPADIANRNPNFRFARNEVRMYPRAGALLSLRVAGDGGALTGVRAPGEISILAVFSGLP
jgi:hypothetical protein